MSWGKILDKVFDWIPGRSETRRNKIDRLEREQNELLHQPKTPMRLKRLDDIASELSRMYTDAKNSAN